MVFGPMTRPGRRGYGRVLLAGDRVAAHTGLRAALAWTRDVGRVDRAADLREALARADAADVVVADLDLLCRGDLAANVAALRAAAACPEVVVATDDAERETVQAAMVAGVRSFLLLSGDVRQAQATVEAALDGRGPLAVAALRTLLDRHAVMLGAGRARERAFVESLAAAVEVKDAVTSAHLRNVTQLALAVAAHVEPALGADEDFVVGCLLHDVGKIAVPVSILRKPGPLTGAEWDVMRRHPTTGVRVVDPLRCSQTVVDVVRHHHERWDGRGYPYGLAGERIPLAARIFSVCDALEAMTAARPYHQALPVDAALERVQEAAGGQFDPGIVAALGRGLQDGAIALERALELGVAAA
jgi:putative nucleotidyltransferase with HDIG domain